jgi:hypothetical protein
MNTKLNKIYAMAYLLLSIVLVASVIGLITAS